MGRRDEYFKRKSQIPDLNCQLVDSRNPVEYQDCSSPDFNITIDEYEDGEESKDGAEGDYDQRDFEQILVQEQDRHDIRCTLME